MQEGTKKWIIRGAILLFLLFLFVVVVTIATKRKSISLNSGSDNTANNTPSTENTLSPVGESKQFIIYNQLDSNLPTEYEKIIKYKSGSSLLFGEKNYTNFKAIIEIKENAVAISIKSISESCENTNLIDIDDNSSDGLIKLWSNNHIKDMVLENGSSLQISGLYEVRPTTYNFSIKNISQNAWLIDYYPSLLL